MLDRLRFRLTYANVMSTIAVFGVLAGGGAYAASKIGPSDIAKDAIRSKHIKENAVKAPEIADGSLGLADVAAWSLKTSTQGSFFASFCSAASFGVPAAEEGDLAIIVPDANLPEHLVMQGLESDSGTVSLRMCNVSTTMINDATFDYTVFGLRP